MLPLSGDALTGRTLLDSHDLNEAREAVAEKLVAHEIHLASDAQQLHAVFKSIRLGSLWLHVVEYGCELTVRPEPMNDFYLLHINLKGQCELDREGTVVVLDERRAAICSPGTSYTFRWHADSRALAVQIPRQGLLAHARHLLGEHIDDNIALNEAIDLEGAEGKALVGLVSFLLQDAELERGICALGAVRHLESALIDTLIRMQPGNYFDTLHTVSRRERVLPFHVRKAEQYMAEHIHRPVRLSELADVTGVSARTLSTNFNRFLGVSPARYFLNMRLERARSVLLDERSHKRVSDVAFELGFNHHGAFAAAYKSRYHESPRETLGRRGSRSTLQ